MDLKASAGCVLPAPVLRCSLPMPSEATPSFDPASTTKLVSGRLAAGLHPWHLLALGVEPGLREEEARVCWWPGLLLGWCRTSFLQASGFGFTEEEKDDGITMSVVSSEGVKSPPSGDHVEAQAAQIDCPPMSGGPTDLFYVR